MNIWLDLDSEDSKIPLFNGRIFLKATRITWNSVSSIPLEKKEEYAKPLKAQNQSNSNYSFNNNQPTQTKNFNYNNNQPIQTNKNNKESDLLDFEHMDLKNDLKKNENKKKPIDDLIDF